MGRRQKLGKETTPPLRSTGPRYLKLFHLPKQGNDWCVPPRGFVSGKLHNSKSEWLIYAAISVIKHDPADPTKAPWVGGSDWSYQDPLSGGRMQAGGQVCDFLVQWGSELVCLRTQTDYFHLFADNAKRIDEFFEKTHSTARIVDIFDADYIGDCTLEAACRTVAAALGGREKPNPGYLGTAQPTRRRGGG
jgi:hypothetical protein